MRALIELVERHWRDGGGVASVCSAHPLAIAAAIRVALGSGTRALVEATCNQVNQYGGYTGQTPADFVAFVRRIAESVGCEPSAVLLGGDHLGPNPWRRLPSADALGRAEAMVDAYVAAGFRKIHLDCSMACAGDPPALADAVVAARAARLAEVAERSWQRAGGEPPVYVVGTEVPAPGGSAADEGLAVTRPEAVETTLEAHREAFAAAGLADAWKRVLALVVQPGVEFGNDAVHDYDRARARALSAGLRPGQGIVYEAHSTDYQRPAALRELVADHFAILKVGPAATFALREAWWALDAIAADLDGGPRALRAAVLRAMHDDPVHWRDYYSADERLDFEMQYSLSDRVRYYWTTPAVSAACEALLARFGREPLPLAALSQYRPCQYDAIRAGVLPNSAREVLVDSVADVLRDYARAVAPGARAGVAP
jgi:D-tagatose-1,6-bisphosphate aldolase subunit GatZ/KbaZ